MHKILLAIALILPSISAIAQSPKWINRPPQSISGNYTYTFIETSANALTLDVGRKKCLQMLSLDRGLMNTLMISYKAEDEIHSNSTTINGKFNENIDEKTVEVITYDGKPVQVTARIIDEYYDYDRSMMHTLYQVGLTENPRFDMAYATNNYGVKGLMSVIPGVGQFYKHHYLKGGLIMGGSVALAGGVIATHMTHKDYEKKLQYTDNVEVAMIYKNRSNHFKLARNICIGALSALYVYNLIDACVTPGARYIKFVKTDNRGNTYTFMPTASVDGVPMIAGSITF